MAAGLGFKTFTTGEVLTAADVNGYLMQGVLVFASEAARDAAITSPQEGQFAYTKDNNSLWYYTGSAWAASGATGDIEGVTAGVGISGGGTSGTVTITNDMATTITASGDIVVGTGSGTYDNLPIGSTGQVLTADTTVSPYKVKWDTPASGGGLTLLSTTSLSGTSTSISITPTNYVNLLVIFKGVYGSVNNTVLSLRLNSDTNTNYNYIDWRRYPGSTAGDFQQGQNQTSQYMTSGSLGTSSGANSFSGSLDILRCNDTSQINYQFRMMGFNDSNIGSFQHTIGKYMASAAITNLTILNVVNSNTLSGTVYVYGVK
jgi:hypothetical protein